PRFVFRPLVHRRVVLPVVALHDRPQCARYPEHLVNDPPIGVGRVNVPVPPTEPGLATPKHGVAAAHWIGLQFLLRDDEGVTLLPGDLIPPILAPTLSPRDVDVVPHRLPAASPCSIHLSHTSDNCKAPPPVGNRRPHSKR